MGIVETGQQQGLILPMWMQDEMILSKIYAPLGATALNIVYYS